MDKISNTVSNTISNIASNTVSNIASNKVSDSVSNIVPHTVSDTVSNIASNTISNKVPNTDSNSVSDIISNIVSHKASNKAPDIDSNTVSDAVSRTVSDTVANTVSNTISNIASNTISNIASNTISDFISNTVSSTVSDTVSNTSSNIISDIVSNKITNSVNINQISTIIKNIDISENTSNTSLEETSKVVTTQITETTKIISSNIISQNTGNIEEIENNTIYHSDTTLNDTNIFNNITEYITTEINKNIEHIPTTQIDKIPENTTSDINAVYTSNQEIISPNTTINYIEITTDKNIVSSTLIEESDLPKNDITLVVFLGLSHFKMFQYYFSFYIYFARIRNTIYSKILHFPIIITYNMNMRVLKETEGNCTLHKMINERNYQFLCEVYEDTTNIKSISIKPDFKFLSQNNINIIGISPFAKLFMNNLQLINEKFDILSNVSIYLLDNSTYDKYDEPLFNISGRINGTQPKFENKNLSVIINLHSEKLVNEIDCIINNITWEKYILNCKMNETTESDLQSAISFIDDGNILLINFADGANSIINVEIEKKISNRLFFRKQNGALKPGIIAALIIIFIVALASIIFIAFYFRKKNIKLENYDDSIIKKLKK